MAYCSMEITEEKLLRKVVQGVMVETNCTMGHKVDEVINAVNSIVQTYKLRDHFSEITDTRDRNLDECSKCLGCCCCLPRFLCKWARYAFWAFILMVIFSCGFYVAWHLFLRPFK